MSENANPTEAPAVEAAPEQQPAPTLATRSKPRPERVRTDAELLAEVLSVQVRAQVILEEVAELLGARGAHKARLRAEFVAQHGEISPENAVGDVSLQLLGLQVKVEQARRDREWIEANKPPKPPKTAKPKPPRARQHLTLDQMRKSNFR